MPRGRRSSPRLLPAAVDDSVKPLTLDRLPDRLSFGILRVRVRTGGQQQLNNLALAGFGLGRTAAATAGILHREMQGRGAAVVPEADIGPTL
jgi:hypothetical protein